MDLLRPYGQYWFVTITPYGKEIEPCVPDKRNFPEARQESRIDAQIGIEFPGRAFGAF